MARWLAAFDSLKGALTPLKNLVLNLSALTQPREILFPDADMRLLSQTEADGLTGGGNTALHNHSVQSTEDNYGQQTHAIYSSSATWHSYFIAGQRARGSSAAPSAVLTNDRLLTVQAAAHDGTGMFNVFSIQVFAAENHTTSARGAKAIFYLVKNGGTSLVPVFQFNPDGSVSMPQLPTSPTGLATGSFWNNNGVPNIV